MKTFEVKAKYYCPFKWEETIELSEYTTDTEVHCNLQDGALCLPFDNTPCPLIDEKIITVTWIGDNV